MRTKIGNQTPATIFAIPLRDSGYACGLIARADRNVILGYFFGPKSESLPAVRSGLEFEPDRAILIGRCGNLGLKTGKWPILGKLEPWLPGNWPVPAFRPVSEVSGRTMTVRYADDDLLGEVVNQEADADSDTRRPDDGLMGAGFVELRLTRLLST